MSSEDKPGKHLESNNIDNGPALCDESTEVMLQRYAAIVQSSGDAIIGVRLDGVIESWNPAAERVYGYSSREVVGSNIEGLIPPEHLDEFRHILRKVNNGESITSYRTKRVRKDGRSIDVILTVSPIKNSRDEIIGASSIVRDITKQELLNDELKKWSLVFEHAGWGVVVCGARDETMDLMNPTFVQMHGYGMGELYGRPFLDMFPPETHARLAGEIYVARERGHHTFESLHVRKDGATFPGLVDMTAVYNDRGSIDHWVIHVQDITERREVERALQRSEESLRQAQSVAGMGSWDWTIASGRVTWSDETFRIYDMNPEEFDVTYDSYLELVHPDDRSLIEQSVREALDHGESFDVEHRILRPDGSTRIVREQGAVFRNPSGKPVRMVGTIHDITDHVASQRQLRKLEMAVEKAYDWILITDREGRIEYANEAVESMTGYTRHELMGQTPRVFKSGKHEDSFYKEMWDTILSGKPYRAIVINKNKKGGLFEVYHSIAPLKDKNGEITHFVATSKDITQQKLLEEKINRLAYYDVLTDLPNRTLFMDRLEQVISRADHNDRNVAVVCIDIDRFSMINDAHGYEFGDAVLKEMGNRFSGATRDGDTVARFGADEFGIILNDVAHSEDVVLVIDQLMKTTREPVRVDDIEVVLTLSSGITLYPDDGKEPKDLLRNADIALSRARGSGMNNYQFFKTHMNIRAAEFVLLDRHLYQALKNNEFILHYQPYFDAVTEKIAGMEALLRWNSKDLGLVMPGRFIPVLEDTGMIVEVGQWVLRTVCDQLRDWQQRGLAIVPVAFNLSGAQFRQKNLIETIEDIIRTTGIDSRNLTLEITESTFMEDLAYTGKMLERLKSIGLRLAIDDFGTGYSSLSYLKRFPVDILKIDISFIRDITRSRDDEAIVSAIISLAHSLKLLTIAEGIETEAQLDILRQLKSDLIQGFYFSRPILAPDVEAYLAE